MDEEIVRAHQRRSKAGLRSHIAFTTLTLVHRVLLLAIAAFRPNDISVAYLFLFLVAHQRLGAAARKHRAIFRGGTYPCPCAPVGTYRYILLSTMTLP